MKILKEAIVTINDLADLTLVEQLKPRIDVILRKIHPSLSCVVIAKNKLRIYRDKKSVINITIVGSGDYVFDIVFEDYKGMTEVLSDVQFSDTSDSMDDSSIEINDIDAVMLTVEDMLNNLNLLERQRRDLFNG